MACNNSLVTIVLPLYRPKGDWGKQLINRIRELDLFLADLANIQYIVVYDDVVDHRLIDAFELIREDLKHVSFVTYGENRGKGYALREGVKLVQTPYTILLDIDFPYKKENIAVLILLLLGNQYDMVVGKRSDTYFRQLPLKRKIISKALSLMNRLLLKLPLSDTQSGIKGFNERGKSVFLQTTIDRFLVDTEFLLRGTKQGLKIKTMNIELRSGVTFSNFGSSVILTELKNFFRLVLLCWGLKTAARYTPSYTAPETARTLI
ncbi:MAG: glycosyltransferase family 2 protein [Williamsia sp.]|nr:glycosyltransferase family 2 protein [Williamsia sp.]